MDHVIANPVNFNVKYNIFLRLKTHQIKHSIIHKPEIKAENR